MGPVGQTNLIGRFLYLVSIGSQHILLLLLCLSPRYQRNIPCTKTRGFGMQILGSRTFEISVVNFYLSSIPWTPKRSFWAGYSRPYVHGRDKLHLLLFPLLSIDTIVEVFLLLPTVSKKNTFLLYFGAKTIWYLQFHFVCAKIWLSIITFFIDESPLWFLSSTGRSDLLYHKGDSFSSVNLYWTTRLSRGFLYTKKPHRIFGAVFYRYSVSMLPLL